MRVAFAPDHAGGQCASHQQWPHREFIVGLEQSQDRLKDVRHVGLPSLCILKIDRYSDAR